MRLSIPVIFLALAMAFAPVANPGNIFAPEAQACRFRCGHSFPVARAIGFGIGRTVRAAGRITRGALRVAGAVAVAPFRALGALGRGIRAGVHGYGKYYSYSCKSFCSSYSSYYQPKKYKKVVVKKKVKIKKVSYKRYYL